MLRVESLDPVPCASLPYLNATPQRKAARARLPLHLGRATGLPAELDGVIVASDLQGRLADDRVLGLEVPSWLGAMAERSVLPALDRLGIVLCGDLYARPGSERRGGKGDVREVWRAFGARFRWVVGVAGNHDLIGDGVGDLRRFRASEAPGFLDGDTVERDGLLVDGVSGVVGNPAKPFRRTGDDYLAAITRVLAERPSLLVLHDGPDDPAKGELGSPEVRHLLLLHPAPVLVLRDHAHWADPLADLSPHCQVVNADARVVALLRDR